MPNLSTEEYAELKNDIANRGVMVPIEFDEQGNILDGHHRLQICEELGIKDFPKVIRAGLTEEEKYTHARKLNLARRHLSQEQKRGLIQQQLQATPEKSDRQIAKDLGVSHHTVSTQRESLESTGQIAQLDKTVGADGKERPRQVERKPVSVFNPTKREEKALTNPKVIERVADGASVLSAQKQVNREEKKERKSYTLPEEMPKDICKLAQGDICTGLPEIADESIDFIITDPPYPAEYIPLYGDLSKLASRVLKPNGSLIVMCGQSYLPEVMGQLAMAMKYHWCMVYQTPGGQSPQLFHKKVNTFWKPVLWFVKGDYQGDWVGDILKSPVNNNDKRFHEWGQSLPGMMEIVERFTNPGDTILDPFLGGGTTGVAAVTMGRKFIGIDIEEKNIAISEERIKEGYDNAGSKEGTHGMA
jgi:site-specific DNA-methyltransferase (adenine-specific)